jgi:hypothetical protein
MAVYHTWLAAAVKPAAFPGNGRTGQEDFDAAHESPSKALKA